MDIYALDNDDQTSTHSDCTLDSGASSARVFARDGGKTISQMGVCCLTSGLVSPHLGHLVEDAGVMFRCDDQYTPLLEALPCVRRFFAQMKLWPTRRGGSPAKPGETVQEK
jgi:hypothetical protein